MCLGLFSVSLSSKDFNAVENVAMSALIAGVSKEKLWKSKSTFM